MSAFALSALIFLLILCGIFAGSRLRQLLPDHHLSKESQDVVRLGAGLVATMSALVLGLLIASAKGTFDTQSTQVKQITANIIVLDNMLSQYGPEARPIRNAIRSALPAFTDRIWDETRSRENKPFESLAASENIYVEIQRLEPANNLQRSLQARATQVATEIAQTRMLLFVGARDLIPRPFLVVLVGWLVIIFASFSLFSDLNATAATMLGLFALSASCAIYLILELSHPFSGLMMISSEPLRNALAPLGS